MNFCLYIPHLLSGLIWKSVHELCIWTQCCSVFMSFTMKVPVRPFFYYGCKWNDIYACTVKTIDLLKVNNTFVKSVHWVTEKIHISRIPADSNFCDVTVCHRVFPDVWKVHDAFIYSPWRSWTDYPWRKRRSILRNVGNHLPRDIKSHYRRTESSTIPLREPETYESCSCHRQTLYKGRDNEICVLTFDKAVRFWPSLRTTWQLRNFED